MIYSFLIRLTFLLITSMIIIPINLQGNTKKSDIKVKVFTVNGKKEIPHKELISEYGLLFCCENGDMDDDLGRIEVSSKSGSWVSIVIVDNNTGELLLKSGTIYLSNYRNKVVFYVFPWVTKWDHRNYTVKVISEDEEVFVFKYYCESCD